MKYTNLAIGAFLLLCAGCQKLNVDRTIKLTSVDVQAIAIDGPRSEQKVAVNVTVSGATVDVYVVPEKIQEATIQGLISNRRPKEVLAAKEKVSTDTIEVTIPAKLNFSIVLANASKECEVKVSIKGR